MVIEIRLVLVQDGVDSGQAGGVVGFQGVGDRVVVAGGGGRFYCGWWGGGGVEGC